MCVVSFGLSNLAWALSFYLCGERWEMGMINFFSLTEYEYFPTYFDLHRLRRKEETGSADSFGVLVLSEQDV